MAWNLCGEFGDKVVHASNVGEIGLYFIRFLEFSRSYGKPELLDGAHG